VKEVLIDKCEKNGYQSFEAWKPFIEEAENSLQVDPSSESQGAVASTNFLKAIFELYRISYYMEVYALPQQNYSLVGAGYGIMLNWLDPNFNISYPTSIISPPSSPYSTNQKIEKRDIGDPITWGTCSTAVGQCPTDSYMVSYSYPNGGITCCTMQDNPTIDWGAIGIASTGTSIVALPESTSPVFMASVPQNSFLVSLYQSACYNSTSGVWLYNSGYGYSYFQQLRIY
jgi:hypothetical protein